MAAFVAKSSSDAGSRKQKPWNVVAGDPFSGGVPDFLCTAYALPSLVSHVARFIGRSKTTSVTLPLSSNQSMRARSSVLVCERELSATHRIHCTAAGLCVATSSSSSSARAVLIPASMRMTIRKRRLTSLIPSPSPMGTCKAAESLRLKALYPSSLPRRVCLLVLAS